MPMKILLRNPKTGAFLKSANDWTLEPWDAQDFQDEERVISAARELGCSEVELIITDANGKVMAGTLVRPAT